MPNSVYTINKGINQPIRFKGLKAQWIAWLGAGAVGLLLVFAILYLVGVNAFVCLGLVGLAGTGLFVGVYRMSDKYGELGWMKKQAKRSIPKLIKASSRKAFIQFKKE